MVLEALNEIHEGNNGYYYQVCLQPGKELYPGIRTFSTLFNLNADDTLEVLSKSGGINKSNKPYFRT
jgi:hypothetical protein